MRRVLVPLDGSPLAEAILPVARQLAGADGELLLVRDSSRRLYTYHLDYAVPPSDDDAYLEDLAELLRGDGVKVQTEKLFIDDVSASIDEAARVFDADFIACATHGRGPLGRLVRGGIAWRAAANSTVPVLLRHVSDAFLPESRGAPTKIMVPLDGSAYAERALPLAEALAGEWQVPLLLVRVVPELIEPNTPRARAIRLDYTLEVQDAGAYLKKAAAGVSCAVYTWVREGGPVHDLVETAQTEHVSHIVMASHGRTGLSRVTLGSVADALVQRLSLPIIIIPAFARKTALGRTEQPVRETALAER